MSRDLLQILRAEMKSYERPKRWTYTTEPFTLENEMLTPKMSLRRNAVLKKYGDRIEGLYHGDGYVVPEEH